MKSIRHGILVIGLAASFLACKQNDTNSNQSTRAGSTQWAHGSGQLGGVVGTVSNSYDMAQQMRGFLGYEVDEAGAPKSAGVNGISFSGVVRFDGYNQFIPAQSYITLKMEYLDYQNVRRTWSGQIKGVQGQVVRYNSYSTAQIVFEDAYGSISLQGYYNATTFEGEMYYSTLSNNAQGKLGTFRIQTCGFFNCVP